ncbi:hypothetical protein ABT404_28630, partial [Streptomyces hyaluromycini]
IGHDRESARQGAGGPAGEGRGRGGPPGDPDRRGSHLTLRHPDAWRICRALAEDAGVVCDYREPDRLRIGPSAAYTRFTDVWDALDRTRRLVAEGAHTRLPHEKARIT